MPVVQTAALLESARGLGDYNHENFLSDKKQRLTAEYKKMDMRLEQAGLWRDDIRHLVSLTETKMGNYLLVNALFAAATVMMFTEGRLESGTPQWAVWMYIICLASTFTFLMCSVIFALHASISAQAFMVRMLTQYQRLPIPTSGDLDRARTFGQAFEGQRVQQAFRIPFLGNRGRTGSLVRRNEITSDRMTRRLHAQRSDRQEEILEEERPEDVNPSETVNQDTLQPNDGEITRAVTFGPTETVEEETPETIDPWRKEERAKTYELDGEHDSEMSDLRHVKLVKEAQMHYMTFDAYARVFMALGINQLLFSLSYYVLGICLFQHGTSYAAISGVAIFLVTAELLLLIDVSWSSLEQFAAIVLIGTGPICMLVASIMWFKHSESFHIWLFIAFFSHGIWMLYLLHMCDAEETIEGTPLPLRFRAVLYMDVFGWMTAKDDYRRYPSRMSTGLDDDDDHDYDHTEQNKATHFGLRGTGTRSNHRLLPNALWSSNFSNPARTKREEDMEMVEEVGMVLQDTKTWRGATPVLVFQTMVVIMALVWFTGAFWALFWDMVIDGDVHVGMPTPHYRGPKSPKAPKSPESPESPESVDISFRGRHPKHHVRNLLQQAEVGVFTAANVDLHLAEGFQPSALACSPKSAAVVLASKYHMVIGHISEDGSVAAVDNVACDQLAGQEIKSISCQGPACESVLVLTEDLSRVTACPLDGSSGKVWKFGQRWQRPGELVQSVAADEAGQVVVGTSTGRVLALVQSSSGVLIPSKEVATSTAGQDGVVGLVVGSREHSKALIALSEHSISAADGASSTVLGKWRLPAGTWSSICSSPRGLMTLAQEDGRLATLSSPVVFG
mmetsp:Transcript_21851/g.46882  ORF Transcript_21851/g.46882 Transcript_21851/m.46882 type:complete len:845 (-) Transcript_21851:99-2633(-)